MKGEMLKSLMISSSSSSSSPVPRFTDDPLATLSITRDTTVKSNHNKFGFFTNRFLSRQQVDDIYAVSRDNPLFQFDRDMNEMAASSSSSSASSSNHQTTEERPSSSRSEQNRSPSTSSGYESAAATAAAVVQHRRQTVVKELGPANDYRRQFVLGSSSNANQRLGRANVLRQNSLYVTRIQMPAAVPILSNRIRTRDDGGHRDLASQNTEKSVPQPVWPHASRELNQSPRTDSAVIEQSDNYVTKILIASDGTDANAVTAEVEGYDSIVTDSLLMWMSYSQETVNNKLGSTVESSTGVSSENVDSLPGTGDRSDSELAIIRQLSQTISQSQTVTTVSRALSKANSISSGGGGSDLYASRMASSGNSSNSNSNSSSSSHRQPTSTSKPAVAGLVSTSLAKRIAMIKERWEQFPNSRQRVHTESDDDDPMASRYQRLHQRYVPKDGDLNFILQTPPLSSSSSVSDESRRNRQSPLSRYHSTRAEERQHVASNEPVRLPPYLLPSSAHLDSDRVSNSSSRSSGSRRVTFSADTVDNENSAPSSTSGRNPPSQSAVPYSQELKLGPQFLSIGYHLYANNDKQAAGGGGYYPYNLQMLSQLPSNKGSITDSKRKPDQLHAIERFGACSVPSLSSSSSAGSSTIIHMPAPAPYGHLQLHPNYGAACQDLTPCVDFTLDSGDVSLLQRRSVNDKLRRRLCCCFLLLLCFAVLVFVVIGLSLYLTHGQRYFGPL